MTEKDLRQVEFFENRVAKNEKNLRRWARREEVGAYRLYDRDIPEIPLSLDRYIASEASEGGDALCLSLYDRPYEKAEEAEVEWLSAMAEAAGKLLGTAPESIFMKTRKRMKGLEQYEKLGGGGAERRIIESGHSFIVNLSDYLDTGLFLDHRPLRRRIGSEAAGKRVLNLFCYTASFSVYAAAGGATRVDSVDLSNTYLDWARRNLELNGIPAASSPLYRAEARAFLAEAKKRGDFWDLIVVDPPTFSNSKASPEDFDVNLDWPALLAACLDVLGKGGSLYFSTNSRRLKWDDRLVAAHCQDVSSSTIPPDFHDMKIHRSWKISK